MLPAPMSCPSDERASDGYTFAMQNYTYVAVDSLGWTRSRRTGWEPSREIRPPC